MIKERISTRKGDYVTTTGVGRTAEWGRYWHGIVSKKEGESVFVYWDGGFSEDQLSIDEVELMPVRALMEKWKKSNKYAKTLILMKEFNLSRKEALDIYNPNPAFFPIEMKRKFYKYF